MNLKEMFDNKSISLRTVWNVVNSKEIGGQIYSLLDRKSLIESIVKSIRIGEKVSDTLKLVEDNPDCFIFFLDFSEDGKFIPIRTKRELYIYLKLTKEELNLECN